MLDPTPLPSGEAYATMAELLVCDDLPAMDVVPGLRLTDGRLDPFWTRPDGSPLTIRVRALSFKERREVHLAAKDDDAQAVLETCLRGIIQPPITAEQLVVLEQRHPAALDAIAETIWALGAFTATMVATEVRRLAGLAPDPGLAPEPPPVG